MRGLKAAPQISIYLELNFNYPLQTLQRFLFLAQNAMLLLARTSRTLKALTCRCVLSLRLETHKNTAEYFMSSPLADTEETRAAVNANL